MKKIVITTESCSDLTDELKLKHNIAIVPMHIVFEHKTVNDGSISVQEIYDYFNKTKQVPKTSAVNPSEFCEFFRKVSKDNDGAAIIHVSYSSEASCTYQNAMLGIEDCKDVEVHIIDSKNVSGGACNVTMIAAKVLQENIDKDIKWIVKEIESYIPFVSTVFVPERLEYLVAGGRVSNAVALGATVLKIKPRIDIIGGKLVATKKYRGNMEKVTMNLVKDFVNSGDFKKDKVYIMYALGADEKVVFSTKQMLMDSGFKDVIVLTTGCVMSTHGGPGAIGISALRKNK